MDIEESLWSRETWKDGTAICEGSATSMWRHASTGQFEVRYWYKSSFTQPVTMAKLSRSWTYLPANWEVA